MPELNSLYSINEACARAAGEMRAWLKKNCRSEDDFARLEIGAAKTVTVNMHLPQTTADFAALIIEEPDALRYTTRFNQDNARACLVEWAELRLYDAAEDQINSWLLALAERPVPQKRGN